MSRRFNRVAVLKGGISSERNVSLNSGAAIADGLRAGKYDVLELDVTDRDFVLPEGVEAVFIALHGTFGEDGAVQQKLLDLGIPFTGSGVESCRIAFDKVLTREKLLKAHIPVPHGELITSAGDRTIHPPLVVKPPREGSSVGCHLVEREEQWAEAFEDTRSYSTDVLVETYISGRELTVGVVDGEALPVVEIRPAVGWYDYESKYITGDTEYTVPAQLNSTLAAALQSMALETFNALGASGMGRVDFRLDPEGNPFVLELNSIPGFTATSLLPKAAEAAGIGFSELCCRIMELAHL